MNLGKRIFPGIVIVRRLQPFSADLLHIVQKRVNLHTLESIGLHLGNYIAQLLHAGTCHENSFAFT
ncbi:hypothetical protein NY99_13085 [Xanthomonas phaseoli pv. phaseoli]|nr:hypothetical protein NY99_13085 [Xanthomonas phaseoli pv. phaseoli]KHF48511.1 hypothetical protein QQ30_10595 [Xanthomonas phaseoli pv. phaseoli]KHS25019.1 hypothetical protein RM60_18195 [Xanthomonas phaseoli pv. phaseoli]